MQPSEHGAQHRQGSIAPGEGVRAFSLDEAQHLPALVIEALADDRWRMLEAFSLEMLQQSYDRLGAGSGLSKDDIALPGDR